MLFVGTKKELLHLLQFSSLYFFKWLTDRDSNPNKRCQKPLCYHYTIGQFLKLLQFAAFFDFVKRFFGSPISYIGFFSQTYNIARGWFKRCSSTSFLVLKCV